MTKKGVVFACFRKIHLIRDFDRFHRYDFDLFSNLGKLLKWLQNKNGCKKQYLPIEKLNEGVGFSCFREIPQIEIQNSSICIETGGSKKKKPL